MQNVFDKEEKYKLYRSIREIIHPSISKMNISDYRIVIEEDILPLRIFYPKKVTNIDKVIIYIHGNGKITNCHEEYTKILKKMAIKTNSLVIAIDYKEYENISSITNKLLKTIYYLYKELERNELKHENITLMGDSTGAYLITVINYLDKEKIISKEVLLYPTLSLNYKSNTEYESINKNIIFNEDLTNNFEEYYNNIKDNNMDDEKYKPLDRNNNDTPNTLLIVGNVDCVKDEVSKYKDLLKEKAKYLEIPFLNHGFLKKMDKDIEEEFYKELNDYLN